MAMDNCLPPDLDCLAGAIALAGGNRAVSAAADINSGNLSRYLRTGTGLSDDRLVRLQAVLGRPGGEADPTRVLTLRAKRADDTLVNGLMWHFPSGARVARAAWSAMTLARVAKFLRIDLAPEIYAITDGNARCVLLLPAGPLLPRQLFPEKFPALRWWEDDQDRAVLEIADPIAWAKGEVDPPTFDEAWPGQTYNPSLDEMLAEIRKLRLSYAEVVRLIHASQAKAKR